MTSCCVRDLECADLLVTADHLSVGILDGRHVGFAEGTADKSQHEGRLANSPSAKDNDSIIVRLLRHDAIRWVVSLISVIYLQVKETRLEREFKCRARQSKCTFTR